MQVWGLLCLALAAGEPTGVATGTTRLPLGTALWRAQATSVRLTAADGQTRVVRADGFGLTLDQEETVTLRFRTKAQLGVVMAAVGDGGAVRQLGTLGRDKDWTGTLPAGRYALMVGGDAAALGSYLLSAARAPQPAGKLAVVSPAADTHPLPFLGSWQLPAPLKGLAMGGARRWAAGHDGSHVWLFDLERAEYFAVEPPPGTIKRVACGPEGWNLLVVTDQQARLYAVPELAPYAQFTAATGLSDAVFVGDEQRLAVLPRTGNVFLTSPTPEDLAFVPRSAGVALEGDAVGERLAVLLAGNEVSLVETQTRKSFGSATWPAAPTVLAPSPVDPAVAAAGPGASQLWRAVPGTTAKLPTLTTLAYSPEGRLVGSDGEVTGLVATELLPLAPRFGATLLSFGSGGARLAASDAAGRLALWDASRPPEPASADVAKAKQVYGEAWIAFTRAQWNDARLKFAEARRLLGQVVLNDDLKETLCLTWLRSSQASYMAKDYEASLLEAQQLVEQAPKLVSAKSARFHVAMGLYRQGDALFELGKPDEARARFREALDKGLDGPAADDARKRLAP